MENPSLAALRNKGQEKIDIVRRHYEVRESAIRNSTYGASQKADLWNSLQDQLTQLERYDTVNTLATGGPDQAYRAAVVEVIVKLMEDRTQDPQSIIKQWTKPEVQYGILCVDYLETTSNNLPSSIRYSKIRKVLDDMLNRNSSMS